MHFTRAIKRIKKDEPVRLGNVIKQPSNNVRVLGVFLDPRLSWKNHKEALLEKLKQQTNAITCLTGSTWGLPLIQAREVYTAVIRPVMSYASHIWHQPLPNRHHKDPLVDALSTIQNTCLRAVVGGFRATPIKTLELLAFIPPLDLYLTTHVAIYRQRAAQNGIDNLILSRCKAIRESLVPRTRVMPVPLTHLTHNQALPASWYDEWLKLPRAACERITKPTSLRKNVLVSKWTDRWRSTAPPPSSAILLPTPTRRILDLHRNLTKGQSSFHTQIISEKIGLR